MVAPRIRGRQALEAYCHTTLRCLTVATFAIRLDVLQSRHSTNGLATSEATACPTHGRLHSDETSSALEELHHSGAGLVPNASIDMVAVVSPRGLLAGGCAECPTVLPPCLADAGTHVPSRACGDPAAGDRSGCHDTVLGFLGLAP